MDPGGGPRRPFWTFFALLELSWGEDGPRMPQERFQDPFWTDFGRFFKDFQWIFDALAVVSSYVLVCYIVPEVWTTVTFYIKVDGTLREGTLATLGFCIVPVFMFLLR